MTEIESQLAGFLPWLYLPVLIVIGIGAVSTVWLAGRFVTEAIFRGLGLQSARPLAGVPDDAADLDSLELAIMRELELPRLISRIMPMLGLIATMIPLGPALAAVASSNDPFVGAVAATDDVASSTVALGSAFTAVIISLLAACTAFAIYTVRRRWLLTELDMIRRRIES